MLAVVNQHDQEVGLEMTIAVELQLRRLDLEADSTLRRLADLDDMLFAEVNGIPLVTIFVEDGLDVVDTVTQALRRLMNQVPEVDALRVNPDLVSMSDIAERVGVSREAVRKWTIQKGNSFPAPFGCVGARQRVWQWADVNSWLKAEKSIDMDEDLPTSYTVDQLNAYLNNVLHYVPASRGREFVNRPESMARVIEGKSARPFVMKHGLVPSASWHHPDTVNVKLKAVSTTPTNRGSSPFKAAIKLAS